MGACYQAAEACGETFKFFIRSSTLLTAASSTGSFVFDGGLRGQLSHLSWPHLPHVFSWSLNVVSHFSQFHLTFVRIGFIPLSPGG